MQVFFYGLFMDKNMLEKKGMNPKNPRKAILKNFKIRIGERASLIGQEDKKAHGILMDIEESKLKSLYAEKSVSDYVLETVLVQLESGEKIEAACYNLPLEKIQGSNKEYARALHKLAQNLNFPEEYLREIKDMPI